MLLSLVRSDVYLLDEFVDSGGAELASRMGAFSADHLMVRIINMI